MNIKLLKQEIGDYKILLFITLFIYIFLFINISHAASKQENYIHIEEITSGMEGIGKTVFSGTKVEEFKVKVIDVIEGIGTGNSYILVKLSGNKIDENGGISSGMSGSPVYFSEKLAGAISHAWEMSEHNLCLITPIKDMLKLFDYIPKKLPYDVSKDIEASEILVQLKGQLLENIKNNIFEYGSYSKSELLDKEARIYFEYMQTPLLISGFHGRSYELLKNKLAERKIIPVQNYSVNNNINNAFITDKTELKEEIIKPGSAVGVQLTFGDVNILTIGTATYLRDNYLLAFGHPFMHFGDVSYLLSAVYIYHSLPNMVMPFKVGTSYRLLGEVIQDREVGVLADLNHFPVIISCRINVSDLDRKIKKYTGIKIVPQKDILKDILPSLIIQSVDSALDRIGSGTANVILNIKSGKLQDNIELKNVYFSESDIAVKCNEGLSNILDLLSKNYYAKFELSEISIDVKVKRQNQSSIIKAVELEKENFYPGDQVEAKIVIKPFLQEEVTKIAKISLPADIKTGEAVLIVKGGASQEITTNTDTMDDKEKFLLNDWEHIQKYIDKKGTNNQLRAEIVLINQNENIQFNKKITDDVAKDKDKLSIIIDTDFIIEGYHEIYINILGNKDKDNE